MFRQNPALPDRNESQTSAPGHGFSGSNAMHAPSSHQSLFPNYHTSHSTNAIQEYGQPLAFPHRSLPFDQQSPNSADARCAFPDTSEGCLHSSRVENVSQRTLERPICTDSFYPILNGSSQHSCPGIYVAGDHGKDCQCEECALNRPIEVIDFNPRKFPLQHATDTTSPNEPYLGNTNGTSLTSATSRSLESRRTPSFSHSALSNSSAIYYTTPSSYEFTPAPYTSSLKPPHSSSYGFPGETQPSGVSSPNKDFAAHPLDSAEFPQNIFSNQNMRVRETGAQKIGPKGRPKRRSRPRHDRNILASQTPDISNVPDPETFLKAQGHLDLELKFGDTLLKSQKDNLANLLFISTPQLESCIKAKHDILPILTDLLPKMASLGVTMDHVRLWAREIETQSLTKLSTDNSACHSHTNPLSDNNGPNKKRKLDRGDESAFRPYQCTHIESNCLHEVGSFTDWKRHEETHWPQKRWECLIQGSYSNVCCYSCSGGIDLLGQPLVNHHEGCIGTTPRKGHSFKRKDKLNSHVKTHHHCIANIDNWNKDVVSDWKRQCGFCGSTFDEWDARCDHVGRHFTSMEGKRMVPDWKDPWPSDSTTSKQGSDDDSDDDDDSKDDDDGEDDVGEEDDGEEDNQSDNDDLDIRDVEPSMDSDDRTDTDRGDPEGSQKYTSNSTKSCDKGGQRQETASKYRSPGEANGESLGFNQPSCEVANDESSPDSPNYQGSQASIGFKYIKKLGYGAFGTVDEVEHCVSKIRFARKTLRVSPRHSASSLAQARREINTLSRLSHQHIINVLASYTWDDHFSTIMFPVAERNLSEFLLDENATTLPQISKLSAWIGCLTAAVSYIHEHSCYHMDIKPNNILISGSHVILADFGGALVTERHQSRSTFENAYIATPMYCAPEIAYQDSSLFIPGANDIFSLGCVLLEMITVIHREKLRTFVDFRTYGCSNATYSSNIWKSEVWIEHLSYINESLGLPRQNWLQIIKKMLSVDSTKRPTAQHIVHSYLRQNLQEKRKLPNGEKYLVISNSSGSFSLIEAARLWLHECQTSHKGCHKPSTHFFPKRILDVSTYNGSIHLQSTFSGLPSPYVTLSHCWGEEREMLKTTKQTLGEMTSGIEISSLPAIFATAVQITQALGFKYLWIDSLCIIQDSEEDWATESSQMGEIYSHSSLTISAISGKQSLNTKVNVLNYEQVFNESRTLCISCSSGYTGFKSLTDDNATTMLFDSPWWQRAWILQERILSPRILYFSSTSIAWECNDSWTTLDTVSRIGKALRLSPAQRNTFSDPKIDTSPLPAQVSNDYMTIWKDLVREYSKRRLTWSQDKLIALSGLAHQIANQSGHTYIAGLWVEHLLPTGLLWSRDFATVPLTRPDHYRAPSWSWASIDSPVTWSKSLPEEDVDPEADIIRHHIIPSSKESPYGAISEGHIVVKGPIKSVPVIQKGSDQLLRRPDKTPFAFAQWDALEDAKEITTQLGGREGNQGSVLWCLKIVKDVGLILAKGRREEPEHFQRVGIFWMQDEVVSKSDISDDWEVCVITLF